MQPALFLGQQLIPSHCLSHTAGLLYVLALASLTLWVPYLFHLLLQTVPRESKSLGKNIEQVNLSTLIELSEAKNKSMQSHVNLTSQQANRSVYDSLPTAQEDADVAQAVRVVLFKSRPARSASAAQLSAAAIAVLEVKLEEEEEVMQ